MKNLYFRRFALKLAVGILCACLAACQTAGHVQPQIPEAHLKSYLQDKPDALQTEYSKLMKEGEHNRVLNQMRLGRKAIRLGYLDEAAEAFDGALDGIERVYADNEQASRARSLWVEEGSKIFKGEPYERVMAYYYRGLLYIWEKDYQNARACFKGGMLQDAFAEEEQYRCDFALMLYLSGWCSQRINDGILAKTAFDEFLKLRPDAFLPSLDDNVLLIVETGKSPRKVADGVGQYQLKFRRGRNFTEKRVQFTIGQQRGNAYPIEDIYWQAATRGARYVDYILQGKAHFKQQTAEVGSILSDAAANTMIAASIFRNSASELQGVGAGLGLISVTSQVFSQKAKAVADTRYWDNLPDAVHVISLQLPPGSHDIAVDFLDENDNLLSDLGQVVSLTVPDSGSTVVLCGSRGL